MENFIISISNQDIKNCYLDKKSLSFLFTSFVYILFVYNYYQINVNGKNYMKLSKSLNRLSVSFFIQETLFKVCTYIFFFLMIRLISISDMLNIRDK